MIKCFKKDESVILDYIGNNFGECLYLYLDFLKYGFSDENINLWLQKQGEKVVLLVLQYYNGMHVFTKNLDEVDFNDLNQLILDRKPTMICGMGKIIKKLRHYHKDYEIEVGYVGKIHDLKVSSDSNCRLANREDLKRVAEFVSKDEALGKPYGFELLYQQMLERYDQKYGRTFFMERNGQIIGTASTYAEENQCAVVSGVLIDSNYRGQGLSKIILSALCENLLAENFHVFSYYYIEQAIKMHHSVGFDDLGEWAKLVKIEEEN